MTFDPKISLKFVIKFDQDISFKLQRTQNIPQRTAINPESPWKLQQIQDAANHLHEAIHYIADADDIFHFRYSDAKSQTINYI